MGFRFSSDRSQFRESARDARNENNRGISVSRKFTVTFSGLRVYGPVAVTVTGSISFEAVDDKIREMKAFGWTE